MISIWVRDTEPGLTLQEMRDQARRCPCGGVDDYCLCQNVPDRKTRAARAQAAGRATLEEDRAMPKTEMTIEQLKEQLAALLRRASEGGLNKRDIVRLLDEAAAAIEDAVDEEPD